MRKPGIKRTPELDRKVLSAVREASQQSVARELGIAQSLVCKIVREASMSGGY